MMWHFNDVIPVGEKFLMVLQNIGSIGIRILLESEFLELNVFFVPPTGNDLEIIDYSEPVPENEWAHLGFSYDSNSGKLYMFNI